jgi:hypothetical protein
MSARLQIVIVDPATGIPITGLAASLTLKYGAAPILNPGVSAGLALAGTFTESPTNAGAYYYDIPQTNQYTIVLAGSPADEYTDVWLESSDIASTTLLAWTTTGNSGATKIGVYNNASRYGINTNVQTILDDITGARTGTLTNQNIAWLYAKVDGWTAVDAEINALTGSGITQADLIRLHAATASAAEISKLTGTSANVTAANLNALTGGGATALHTHSAFTAVTSIRGTQSTNDCLDLLISTAAFAATGNGGDLLLNCAPVTTGTWGAVQINTTDGYYEVITKWHTGTFDYAGSSFLTDIDSGAEGALKSALMTLDNRIGTLWNLQYPGQYTIWKHIYSNPSKQTTGAVTGGTSATLSDWHMASASETIIARVWLNPTDEFISRYRLQIYAMIAGGATGTLKITHVTSGIYGTVDVKSTSPVWYKSSELALAQSYSTPQEFTISMKGSGSYLMTVYENFLIEGR